jgi:hypothetical protein
MEITKIIMKIKTVLLDCVPAVPSPEISKYQNIKISIKQTGASG